MPPKSNVPIRICGSRTRLGCRTCKQRHVKCDEGQPVCLRCRKANRECVYEIPQEQKPIRQQRTSPDQEVGLARSVVSNQTGFFHFSTMVFDINPYGPREGVEVGAVQGFVSGLGKEISGCFSDNLWCQVLPRVAQHEPAIWHAVVAVSTLHANNRNYLDGQQNVFNLALAIKHYRKALRELNLRIASGGNSSCKDVVLLSCVLFVVFESLQDRYESALHHISGGMKLLAEWENEAQFNGKEKSGVYLDRRCLQPMFLAMDSQAVQMGAGAFRDYLQLPALNSQLQIPAAFATLDEAHVTLNQIFNRMSHWGQWIEPTMDNANRPSDTWLESERETLQHQLDEWDQAFDIALKIHYPKPAALMLLIQRRIVQIFFKRHSDGPTETEWDKYLPLFKEAVKYAEAYMRLTTRNPDYDPMKSETQQTSITGRRAAFTVSMDLVLPLFFVCVKCRDSKVRRKALAMLKVCNRKEGIWDSNLCAKIAERSIELEEAGALADGFVPEDARVFALDVRLDDDVGGEVTHNKLIEDDAGGHRVEKYEEVLLV